MTALATASVVVGTVIAAANMPGVLCPRQFGEWVARLPRHRSVGISLMIINTIWTGFVVYFKDPGDIWVFPDAWIRYSVFWLGPILFFLVVMFADQFLAARAIGILLILAANPLLIAAFPEETPWRHVVSVLAYVWVVVGMILVASPYRLRDHIQWMIRTAARIRVVCSVRVLLGLFLLLLGSVVY